MKNARPITKGKAYCPICEAGPFKSKRGVAVHGGKAENVESHASLFTTVELATTKLAKTKAPNRKRRKSGKQIVALTLNELKDKWLGKFRTESSKEKRELIIDFVFDLEKNLSKI